MPKFFFDESSLDGSCIELTGETAHHIVNVLRHGLGDRILLCDGKCTDYVTKLISSETGRKFAKVKFEIMETKKCVTEPPIFVRLFQSVIKWENLDIVIQKSVEVGVSEIVPIVTERSIYKLSNVKKKTVRFGRIAKSAAEQSMRGIIPKVAEPKSFYDSLKNKEATALFACCSEGNVFVHEYNEFNKVDLWVGPEGGFTETERKLMLDENIIPIGLGPRVLRSETASVAFISSIILHHER